MIDEIVEYPALTVSRHIRDNPLTLAELALHDALDEKHYEVLSCERNRRIGRTTVLNSVVCERYMSELMPGELVVRFPGITRRAVTRLRGKMPMASIQVKVYENDTASV
jgi:hypothetical protein